VSGFGRTIALWGFIAVQQINGDFDTDSFGIILAAVAKMCTSQLS
jgi:hypothetical protein